MGQRMAIKPMPMPMNAQGKEVEPFRGSYQFDDGCGKIEGNLAALVTTVDIGGSRSFSSKRIAPAGAVKVHSAPWCFDRSMAAISRGVLIIAALDGCSQSGSAWLKAELDPGDGARPKNGPEKHERMAPIYLRSSGDSHMR